MSLHQRLAWVYCALFLSVVALTHAPFLIDEERLMLGLFKIDPVDDVIHMISAIAAGMAAWYSERSSIWYFRIFGVFYGLDAILGLINGYSLAVNLPHIVISSIALAIGFAIPRRRIVHA